MRLVRGALSLLFALVTLAFARLARADGETSLAALGGWGYSGDLHPNELGAAFGMRVGYTFVRTPVYLGGAFVYHVGYSRTDGGAQTSARSFLPGVEIGVSLRLRAITLRPHAGVGDLLRTSTFDGTRVDPTLPGTVTESTTAHDSFFAIWPGLTALVGRDRYFFGVDGRFLFTSRTKGPVVFATAGLTF